MVNKKLKTNPKQLARMRKVYQTEEYRDKHRIYRNKRYHSDEAYRKAVIESVRKYKAKKKNGVKTK